jgi:iron complex outermembrane receptor protein
MKPFLMRALTCAFVLVASANLAGQTQNAQLDLTALKIEDLMNVDVTSASKKEQKLSQVPAAIFVITKEDIHRSGASNVADLLRMVPGLDVAQVNASTWAISARGFNGQHSNKLLVLIDGRTVYTPTFSGVFWDSVDVPLDSIERIEVTRGPGASVWGTNAVNGVIDIITKSARDTQSGYVTASGGSLVHAAGALRYGGRLGNRVAYRAFIDGFDMDSFVTPQQQNAQDDWHRFHGGFRLDAEVTAKDSLIAEGEAIRGNGGEMADAIVSVQPPVTAVLDLRDRFSGWSVLGRWKHVISPRSETSLQMYFDRSNRGDTTYGFGLNTVDIDFEHHLTWGQRQDFVWGLGYRASSDHTATLLRSSFTPPNLTTQIFSSFVQDEIAIVPHRLSLSLGTKLEHAYYNGLNLQPTARMAWTPGNREIFWAAVSGAQRIPSRTETAVRFNYTAQPGPDNLPILISLFGNPKLGNEHLTATEAGFRKQIAETLSLDLTAFFNQYRHLVSEEPGSPRLEGNPPPEHLLYPLSLANLLYGETHGVEMFANVKLASRWTISPGYTFLTMHLHKEAASLDTTTVASEEWGFPRQQAQLRSNVNLPWHSQWTTSAYFVGRLAAQKIPSYTGLDSNLVWQPSDKISLGFGGQDLLKNFHQEYSGLDLTVLPSLIPRSAYARITWRF